jgi:hypothetical protein
VTNPNNPNDPINTGTRDGGIYISNDSNETPKIYIYLSMASVPTQVPPAGVNCSDVAYERDPSTSKIVVVSLAPKDMTGTSATDLIGRPNAVELKEGAPGSKLIVDSMVGNIEWSLSLQDPAIIAKLKGLAANRVAIKELPSDNLPH